MLKWVTLLVVLVCGACAGGEGADPAPAELAGAWCDDAGRSWAFEYSAGTTGGPLEHMDGARTVRGSWALEGDQLTVWDGQLDPWDGEVSTRYTVRLEAGELELDGGDGAVVLSACEAE